MRKTLLSTLVMLMAVMAATAQNRPAWYESPDRDTAMRQRLLRDFPYTLDEGLILLQEKYPEVTADLLPGFIANHYIETMDIDGVRRMFRKSPRNLGLLHPWRRGGIPPRGWNATAERIAVAKAAVDSVDTKRVKVRFTVKVPYNAALEGDTLSVWLPFPIASERQSDVRLLAASQPDYILADADTSIHRTIYFQKPVVKGDTARFSYEAEYTVSSRYLAPDSIMAHLRPYDREGELYKRYTAMEAPHIVRLDSLARAIVGDESDPFKLSELVYDYIVSRYPWAGAREYSTIPCIPEYVIERGYGDCGQVSLLYISLLRTLGVPARWESGFMIHPGEVGMHDWAEVYFEGVGWVPVDVSFGRYLPAEDSRVVNFYSTGIDAYRMATNRGVCGAFYPAKRYMRSETVDSQAGEVETSRGNLFYPGWSYRIEIMR